MVKSILWAGSVFRAPLVYLSQLGCNGLILIMVPSHKADLKSAHWMWSSWVYISRLSMCYVHLPGVIPITSLTSCQRSHTASLRFPSVSHLNTFLLLLWGPGRLLQWSKACQLRHCDATEAPHQPVNGHPIAVWLPAMHHFRVLRPVTKIHSKG